MTAAETSTRTPMSTGLVRIAMCRRLHSSMSQAAPSRPGAAMTASAVSRVPSARTTPVARSSLSPAGFSTRILSTRLRVSTSTLVSSSARMRVRMS